MRARAGTMRPGDVYMMNAPYNGGTHLPDITVVTPVFDAAGDRPPVLCRRRGHHADIGGVTPGSMPPDSRDASEEGIVIDDFLLVTDDLFGEEAVAACSPPGPIRPECPIRMSPISRPRWPPMKKASRNCAAWSAISAWTPCMPICAMSRTMPPRRSGTSWRC